MKNVKLVGNEMKASEISLGCMRISSMSNQEISTLIHTAMDEGINFFDHADVYGGGKCEQKFSEALDMKPSLRDKMILQTKVGISKDCFDFSKEHILEAVDGSLKRLRTEYVDVVLLHRPTRWWKRRRVPRQLRSLETVARVNNFWFGTRN